MIKFLSSGQIYEKIVSSDAKGLFIVGFFYDKKIEIFYPDKNSGSEVLEAYHKFIVEENSPREFIKVVKQEFSSAFTSLISQKDTVYLCLREEIFSRCFVFTIDDSPFFRMASISDMKKYC